ncbi:hypothetical protein LARV_00238 [Longilinea arvoryzae]|uniref:DUF7000 domain-containing protein n=1 Tax=Longilinea arvoryzae TaxID=360412 RepID=A0A0S7B693_9CHLR|nr:hypothetical protein [Longilinea arvoryzae]GAP12503.1 hypothetical protein LARV_00238 [Longilinea arvoryzae]
MESFHESMNEYRKQLEKGVISKAYKGLMEYILELRTHFQNSHPDFSVPGSIYFGYMDMTYFSILPQPLKDRKLKIAIVFLHEAFRFEVWLAAVNKQVQTQYWKLFKESGWKQYRLVSTPQGADSILEFVLVDNPDFTDLAALTQQIEAGTLKFIADIEDFLAQIKNEGD